MQRGIAIFSFHHRNFSKPSADHLTHDVLMASIHPAGDSYNHRPSDLQKLHATLPGFSFSRCGCVGGVVCGGSRWGLFVAQWAGEHFIFVASSFGPLRVNPLFTINYTANYDGVNGWYYQIGVIKYNFLD